MTHETYEQKLDRLYDWISHAKSAVFFGGAGVSTESGVPDFRSKDGLYNQHDVRFDAYRPEYLLSSDCLIDHPDVFFEFYRQKMDARHVKPNDAHRFLADLERKGILNAVVTQNIDGLHQKAGSRHVCEIHGTTLRNYCMKCGKTYGENYIYDSPERVPRCSCGGIIRCDVTLYGESLPEEAVQDAVHAIRNADLLIIGGTSLTVYPAASFVRYFRGEHIVIINKEHLDYPLDPENDLEINGPIGAIFRELSGRMGF
ncbi:MAG: NAD-dependent protein deacylase [Clostridia bacterium]|nr:NAD-dependent protein deacylase [Clostridia bacterium]